MERFIGRVVTEIHKDHKRALNLNSRSLIGIPNGLRITETVLGKTSCTERRRSRRHASTVLSLGLIENASDRVPLRCESLLPEAFPIKPSDHPPSGGPSSMVVSAMAKCQTVIRGTASVDTPYPRCDHLQQMTIGVAEIKRLATVFPSLPELNRNSLLRQPCLPSW